MVVVVVVVRVIVIVIVIGMERMHLHEREGGILEKKRRACLHLILNLFLIWVGLTLNPKPETLNRPGTPSSL